MRKERFRKIAKVHKTEAVKRWQQRYVHVVLPVIIAFPSCVPVLVLPLSSPHRNSITKRFTEGHRVMLYNMQGKVKCMLTKSAIFLLQQLWRLQRCSSDWVKNIWFIRPLQEENHSVLHSTGQCTASKSDCLEINSTCTRSVKDSDSFVSVLC